ncbi:RagB/SusD family nutrient uptake outer membrane protein [Pedobacter sp. BS3]|uniref:RagB/SusD family nutrient uptake outer membrane protein n=1 Tax=Pedobacter sp. BS3 TaxID=2567937 RepID=UPI0011EEA4D3|nr:RagB/SusD family nutrient uptake outer membrane protein [Pedobacter sp. BS3]TZF83279.1 RagB/SusD family nutrient uptake outer membrane protein [Pedobacter sp. BS3]
MKLYNNIRFNVRKSSGLYLVMVIVLAFTGCKDDFLQDGTITDGPITEGEVWGNDAYARGVLNNAYFSIPEGYSIDGNGGMLASGTDEAVNSGLNATISIFNNGTWSPLRTVDDQYDNLYEGLRKVNLFLQNLPGSAIIPTDGLTVEEDKSRLKGQAFFLRALFHFELVKRYGAVTLATRVFNRNENLNLPKNTYKECVDQVIADCDSAVNTNLPQWTGESSGKYYWRSGDKGRATKTAAMALKSRMLLYAASPLNSAQSGVTWQDAANAAKAIIDLGLHSLLTSYYNIFNYGAAPYNNEVIFATYAQNRNDIEQDNAPISYDGARGRTNPTQEMVDAFETTNGRLVSDPANTQYDANNPYANRDPRFALTINYNGRLFKNVAVQTYIGGKDGINQNINATKTGYYLRKFLSESATWNQTSNTLARRPWVMFRYAEILLNYAEALNEAQGVVAATEVLKYVNMVRQRTGINMPVLQTTNPSANGYVEPTQEAIRERIHNERRVELCFEGHRFYDVRRWKQGDTYLNKPVSGMRITIDGSNLVYTRFTVENRVFEDKNYWYPFSQNTVNRQPALVQNTGY